jgi:hypothetical protein
MRLRREEGITSELLLAIEKNDDRSLSICWNNDDVSVVDITTAALSRRHDK